MSRVFELGVNLLRQLKLRKRHCSVDDFQVCLRAFRTHKANFFFVWQSDERFLIKFIEFVNLNERTSDETQFSWNQVWQTSQEHQLSSRFRSARRPFLPSKLWQMQVERAEVCFWWHGLQVNCSVGDAPTQVAWNGFKIFFLDNVKSRKRKLPVGRDHTGCLRIAFLGQK